MWWISRFKVSKLMKRPQQRLRIARNSVYEKIYEKIPLKSLAELPIVLCHYCWLLCVSSRRKRPIFWYGLQPIFAHLCWQTAPSSQKHQSHSFDVYGLFILPISRSLEYPIPAYLLSFCFWRRSLFSDCDSKGENNQQHYQWNIFNCQTLLDLGNCLGWTLDAKNRIFVRQQDTTYFLETLQELQMLSSILFITVRYFVIFEEEGEKTKFALY